MNEASPILFVFCVDGHRANQQSNKRGRDGEGGGRREAMPSGPFDTPFIFPSKDIG